MGAYKNKQAVKSLLLTGVVLVVGVVVYMSWIGWYTNKYKNMENTYIRCIIENVISQYPDFDMEEIAIILNKSYGELESSTTSEEFYNILRKNGITDNTFYIKDMSDIRNVNIIVSTLIIGVMSVLFIICFYIYLRRRKNAIVQLQDYMDKISRGNYELEINDNSEDDTVNFLLATSGLNISDCLFSLMAIYIIGNPRSGIAVYMSYLISDMSISHLVIFIFASLIAVSISLILCLKLGDSFSKLMGGVDYRKLSIAVIILQIGILYIFTLYYKAPIFYMTLALITSTALGMLPHYVGVGKSHLMGVLIVPAIVIYMQMFI